MKKQTRKNNPATETKDKSPFVFQDTKVNYDLKIREFPWSEKQQRFLQLASDKNTKMILVKGPAGSAKSLCAIYSCLKGLEEGKFDKTLYIRNPAESSKYTMGFLKGDLGEKMAPYLAPLEDKLNELLSPNIIKRLKEEGRIEGIPVGFLRGRSFDVKGITVDEAQNFSYDDLLLTMSRVGKFSKLFLIGDTMQIDIKNSAFANAFDTFNNPESREKGIFTFEFSKEDIFRSEILSFIIGKFEELGKILK